MDELIHNTSWLAPDTHMRPPNLSKLSSPDLPTSGTEIKHVIAPWIALLVMEDGWVQFDFAHVINPHIIKATIQSPCVTHPLNLKRLYRLQGPKNR